MGILDLLFGKKIIRQDDFFGEMTSDRTRKKDETAPISWGFSKKIGLSNKETYIILEGNCTNVNPTQKLQLQTFIENFDATYALDVDKLIASDTKFMEFKNWRNDYYIAFIGPLWGSNTNFEFNFESIEEEKDKRFYFELINGVLKNIAIH